MNPVLEDKSQCIAPDGPTNGSINRCHKYIISKTIKTSGSASSELTLQLTPELLNRLDSATSGSSAHLDLLAFGQIVQIILELCISGAYNIVPLGCERAGA